MATVSRVLLHRPERVHEELERVLEELRLTPTAVSAEKLIVTTPASLASWGETLEIHVTDAHGSTTVTATCTPRAQLFDWGKSEALIAQVMDALLLALGES